MNEELENTKRKVLENSAAMDALKNNETQNRINEMRRSLIDYEAFQSRIRNEIFHGNSGLKSSGYEKALEMNNFEKIIAEKFRISSRDFEKEYIEKKKELDAATEKYKSAIASQKKTTHEIAELESQRKELESRLKDVLEIEKLSFFKSRIHPDAFTLLRASDEFRQKFFAGAHQTTVISIDIRKSTRLMLIAKTPKDFAQFTSELAQRMRQIVIEHHGIFDKFTGDGILAYFPEFYSGKDHVTKAIDVAVKVHEMFDEYYSNNKHRFKTRPTDLGLGIGIDSGLVNLEEVEGEIYIIGDPVVYACRFGSAPAKKTWANPRIEDNFFDIESENLIFSVGETEIKGEGKVELLEICGFSKLMKTSTPKWNDQTVSANDEQSDKCDVA